MLGFQKAYLMVQNTIRIVLVPRKVRTLKSCVLIVVESQLCRRLCWSVYVTNSTPHKNLQHSTPKWRILFFRGLAWPPSSAKSRTQQLLFGFFMIWECRRAVRCELVILKSILNIQGCNAPLFRLGWSTERVISWKIVLCQISIYGNSNNDIKLASTVVFDSQYTLHNLLSMTSDVSIYCWYFDKMLL